MLRPAVKRKALPGSIPALSEAIRRQNAADAGKCGVHVFFRHSQFHGRGFFGSCGDGGSRSEPLASGKAFCHDSFSIRHSADD